MVELFKQLSDYTDKDGKKRTATNFFLQCGSVLIPIEVKYFKDKKNPDTPDMNYRGRKMILSAVAVELPKKEKKDLPEEKSCPICGHPMIVDDREGDESIYFLCENCGCSFVCYSDGTERVLNHIDDEVKPASQTASLTPISDDLPI